jgi:fructokinase
MITVAGEALTDLLVDTSGSVTAHVGGGPFNVARTIARLGGRCRFLGRLSDDAFGEELRSALERAGVELAIRAPVGAPTTLALGQVDASGSVDYRFYLDGTAAAQIQPEDVPPAVLGRSDAIVLGGLGIVLEPIASTLAALVARVPPHVTVLLDPNCRPRAIRDLPAYRAFVASLLARVDIVKVSVEDLAVLHPSADARTAAGLALAGGPRAVLVTDGPRPVLVHTAAGAYSLEVPAVEVADTVGAGDALVAGFLTWWSGHSLAREDAADTDALLAATEAAIEVAAVACTVRGADLPKRFVWSRGARVPVRRRSAAAG